MAQIVYILTNQEMPGLVKLGSTTGDLATRIRQLFSTGVPLPFELFYACEVADAGTVERALHDAFDDHRVSQRREFFRIAPERVKAALSIGALREVSIREEEAFETPEDRTDVEVARRRSRFRFSMVGIVPGAELHLHRDPTITCMVHDENNKVFFKGQVCSLTDAADQAFRDLGFEWTAISGPRAWAFNGERLDDIREHEGIG